MSEWKGAEQRIDVPYNRDRSFLLIEHPCFIKNVETAIQMHGGMKNIEKIYNDTHKRLPLKFRPNELYCKPAFADQYSTTKLLMKVKRRTLTTDDNKTTVEYSAEILGHINKVYTFNSMVDFQYLPVQKTADDKYESFSDKIVLDKLVDREEYLRQDVPLFIPPLMFSRVDKPSDSLLKRAIVHHEGYVNPDTQRPSNFIGTVRQRRSIYTIFVNFGEAVPEEPLDESKKKLTAVFVDPAGEVVIRKLFEEKPLWLKVELEHRTGYSSDKLKTYLPAISYYWLDGPWRAQWNKFGFDPTKDTSAKIYQTIDFRIRQLKPGQINVKAKRSDTNFSHWNQLTRNQQVAAKIDVTTLGENVTRAKATEDKENYYKYRPDRIPPQKMMYYPMNYVYVDEIQKMLHMNDGKEKSCDEKDGWCVSGLTDHSRDIMFSYTDRLLSGGVSIEPRFKMKKKKKKRTLVVFPLESEDSNSQLDTKPLDSLSSVDGASGDGVVVALTDSLFVQGSRDSGDALGAVQSGQDMLAACNAMSDDSLVASETTESEKGSLGVSQTWQEKDSIGTADTVSEKDSLMASENTISRNRTQDSRDSGETSGTIETTSGQDTVAMCNTMSEKDTIVTSENSMSGKDSLVSSDTLVESDTMPDSDRKVIAETISDTVGALETISGMDSVT